MVMISIGLPVYNGDKYLTRAIESILMQTHQNLELIISDNASNDETRDICEHYKNIDRRVRYKRNNANIGAAKNFNNTFALANGKYFRWMAHDDVCAPSYLEECVNVLEKDHSVVLCHTDIKFIDEKDEVIKQKYH